jgi:hypothetical protein
MNRIQSPGLLGYLGILGGVGIAIGLPWITLVYGGDLSELTRVALIILALLGGVTLAVISAVVGIAVPAALTNGKLDIATCCRPGEEQAPQRPDGAAARAGQRSADEGGAGGPTEGDRDQPSR